MVHLKRLPLGGRCETGSAHRQPAGVQTLDELLCSVKGSGPD